VEDQLLVWVVHLAIAVLSGDGVGARRIGVRVDVRRMQGFVGELACYEEYFYSIF